MLLLELGLIKEKSYSKGEKKRLLHVASFVVQKLLQTPAKKQTDRTTLWT